MRLEARREAIRDRRLIVGVLDNSKNYDMTIDPVDGQVFTPTSKNDGMHYTVATSMLKDA